MSGFWRVRGSCSPATAFDKTSIRAIATAAGVDAGAWCTTTSAPSSQLFAAAIHIPIDPMQVHRSAAGSTRSTTSG